MRMRPPSNFSCHFILCTSELPHIVGIALGRRTAGFAPPACSEHVMLLLTVARFVPGISRFLQRS